MGNTLESGLEIDGLRAARRNARMGRTIHYLHETGSTNDVARQLALEGAEEGTVVIAETQTLGRGRLRRQWVSPPGRNLYLSIVLRPKVTPEATPRIALVAGLATAEAVREHVPGAAIKWPNDVVIDGRKVAGILAEMEAGERNVAFVILGIGVNLNGDRDDFPRELRPRAIHVREATRTDIDRADFCARLLSRFEQRYDTFLAEGFAALRPVWQSLSCLSGRRIRIEEGGQFHEGIVSGVSDEGALLLRSGTGSERAVVAGEVTVVDGYGGGPERTTDEGNQAGTG